MQQSQLELFIKKHLGNFGKLGTISFNGNKTITCGNGGVIITSDKSLAKKLKHLSTTAKKNINMNTYMIKLHLI